MNNKKYIIFDLDGTLIDSFPTVINACKRVFVDNHVTRLPKDIYYEKYCANNMEELFKSLAQIAGLTSESFRFAYDKAYAKDFISGTKPITKQYKKLLAAKKEGLGVIVLTNKLQAIAEEVCNHFFSDGEIDIVIGRENAKPIKPKQVLVERFHAHNIEPQIQCLKYYGDSEVDYKSAKLLKVPYIKVYK